jgi:hypothetical protein
MSFEIHGLILACHYEARFLKSKTALSLAQRSFEHILRRYGADKTGTRGPGADRQDRLAAAPASKSGTP